MVSITSGRLSLLLVPLLLVTLPTLSCDDPSSRALRSRPAPNDPQKLFRLITLLAHEYPAMGKPQPGDWLKRALKLAVHETGHMFSMQHCVKHYCVMNGCNHLGETDRSPLDVCPECLAKICYLANYEPVERFGRLAEFCKAEGFKREAELFVARQKLLLRDW